MARPPPRTIAYLRVSTHEQDVAKNQTDILLLAHRQQLNQTTRDSYTYIASILG
jgi:DNA invertase Pin-like site-specific DNA recombinase